MTTSPTTYTILVTPLWAVGHVNACTGALAPLLLRRNHVSNSSTENPPPPRFRIIFLIESQFAGKVAPLGFEERIVHFPKEAEDQNAGDTAALMLRQSKVIGDYPFYEKLESMIAMQQGDRWLQQFAIYNQAIEEALKECRPDLIYYDDVTLYPAVHYSAIPWIKNISTSPPYYLLTPEVPPGCSGLPSQGADPKEVARFTQLRQKLFFNTVRYNDLFEALGYARYPGDALWIDSQVLTVYAYPEEINYDHVKGLSDWFNLEVFNKPEEYCEKKAGGDSLANYLPEEFLADDLGGRFSGKYIYLSMGSMGSIDLELMRRLVGVFASSPHKYIVSKGSRHEELELPRNAWGRRFLPQLSLVPLVDLVITHGGNNTVTETFALGKPMLVLPLFGDQVDNAQRLQETGYGRRLPAYSFTEEEMTSSVNSLLEDTDLQRRMKQAARRIHSTNRHQLLADRIEQILLQKQNATKADK